jgi:hypothetical protein
MRAARRSLLTAVVLAAAVAAPAAAVDAAATPTIHYTACKGAVQKAPYRCVGPFSLGIPASLPRVYFFLNGAGLFKKGVLETDILDASKQPLTPPVTVKIPMDLKGLVWFFSLPGPFPKQTIYLQAKVNGQPVGPPQLFRFV